MGCKWRWHHWVGTAPTLSAQALSLRWLFSRSVVPDSLRPHGLQHVSLPCPSPSLGACSSSYPLSQWCHPNVSVQFSHSVMSNSLWPHGLEHARPPCPSPTPGVYSNSCPLSRWCHPTISSSVVPFSSCLQSFAASGSFQMSQLFASGGQSIGASASV